MGVQYVQASSDEELKQILDLQQQNLPKNLSQAEIQEQGFVTVEHDFEILKAMNDVHPHTIAKADGRVVGYALSMHPQFANEVEVLKPMFKEIKKVLPKNENYFAMGQVCVAKSHRGQGVFRMLYLKMKSFLPEGYHKIITEVDTQNTRSMAAHKAIGFTELKRYHDHGKEWSLVVLE